jgi:hypothetical protein
MRIERESEEGMFNTYLDAFSQIADKQLNNVATFGRIGNPNYTYTFGELMFTYNLLVNKNQFGDSSLTKIFSNMLNDYRDIKSLNPHGLIVDFFNFESDIAQKDEFKFTDKDFKENDLKIRLASNDSSKEFYYKIDRDTGLRTLFRKTESNEGKIPMLTADNTLFLPYLTETNIYGNFSTIIDFTNKLMKM